MFVVAGFNAEMFTVIVLLKGKIQFKKIPHIASPTPNNYAFKSSANRSEASV